jgi:capsular exopolysaccharide synthesis family protein
MGKLNNNQATVNLLESDDKYLELLEFCFDEDGNGKAEVTEENSGTRAIKRSVPANPAKVVQDQRNFVKPGSSSLRPQNMRAAKSASIDEPYISRIKSLSDQVLNFYLQKKYKSFVWTAFDSGAGTSTIVSHLACLLADLGLKVLIIDANFDNPVHHVLFNQENELGVTEVLNHGYGGLQITRTTTKKNLYLISSKEQNHNLVHLMKNQKLQHAFEELKSKFDLILIDAPSLENYLSTLVFASIADGCILVASAERTRLDKAEGMVKQLQSGGVNILGLVLNRKKSYLPKFLMKRL